VDGRLVSSPALQSRPFDPPPPASHSRLFLHRNHGGGYVYSLCPENETLTEACFQKTTLPFVGSFHKIRRLDNTSLPEPEYTMCVDELHKPSVACDWLTYIYIYIYIHIYVFALTE
jgi:hypothetical protein